MGSLHTTFKGQTVLKQEEGYTVYLCKTCGHNVCYPFILHSTGIITDGKHDMVYVGLAKDEAEFEAYYYTHEVSFSK